jgi:hypothetical protein
MVHTSDVEVNLGHWVWAGLSLWPPWERLRKAAIWDMPHMQHIRDNLATAIMDPTVTTELEGVMSLSPGPIAEDIKGIMHLFDITPHNMVHGQIPFSISSLPYKGVVVNVPENLHHTLHHFVVGLVKQGCPVILLGTDHACGQIMHNLADGRSHQEWSIVMVDTYGKHWPSEHHDQGVRKTVLIHPKIKIDHVCTTVSAVCAVLCLV